ncbi:TniQ family protein [Streptomyces sp. NPDC006510]|uniref:TniQ family protein n=1 Tax=Streptomyces sp. NPDC006510 TaxID=3155600 RepID=UPI0033B2F6CE
MFDAFESDLRPLPRSLDPLEGESLHGYLLRLSHRLGAAPVEIAARTGLVSAAARMGTRRVPMGLLHHLDDQRRGAFASTTQLTSDEVRGLLTAPLGSRYGPLNSRLLARTRTLEGMLHNNSWIHTRTTRYCPTCLSGDGSEIEERHGGTWRRTWRLPPVFACLRHERLLLNGCPRCGQDVNATRAGGLIARSHEADLHPAQCRATTPGTRAVCGARLAGVGVDRAPQAPTTVAALLRLQYHFDNLLAPDGPTWVGSFGWMIPAAQYFIDLRALSGLIFMTWPQARDLAETPALATFVDREAERRHAAFAESRAPIGKQRRASHHYSEPSADPVVAGAVFGIAARLLSAPDEISGHEAMAPIIDKTRRVENVVGYQFRALNGLSRPASVVLLAVRQDKGAFARIGQRIEDQGFRRLVTG